MKIFNHLLEIKRFRFLWPILVLSALFTRNPKPANAGLAVITQMTCPVVKYSVTPSGNFPIIEFWKNQQGWTIQCGDKYQVVCRDNLHWLDEDTPARLRPRMTNSNYQSRMYPQGTHQVTFRYNCFQ